MEKFKNEKKEQDFVFSKSIKAGTRIYYLDVKRSKNLDLYLSITESKKKFQNDDINAPAIIEKHKIFLYKEDFDKFTDALTEIIDFIKQDNLTNGAIDCRDKHNYKVEEIKEPITTEEEIKESIIDKEETAPKEEEKKYDFDVDFEI